MGDTDGAIADFRQALKLDPKFQQPAEGLQAASASRPTEKPIEPHMQSKLNDRVVPLIVAVALFMENMDSTVIATSLPAIARAIGTNPLALKLAVTSYLLSLAICIPASGWTADRFGARNVFRIAIGVFILGSIGCAASHSLTEFVIARIVQGMGGAMMTPVGRLIMVRSIDKHLLLNAMSLVTVPALIGPICGPPLGGFITTYASWHWIFLINVPIGLVGIVAASRFIPNVHVEHRHPFDFLGFVLSGLGIGGLAFGLSVMGLDFLPVSVVAALLGVGAIATIAYVFHARRTPAPILDLNLLKLPTFRASIVGGFLFRLGVGALPFLLPLLLQIGFQPDAVSIRPDHLYQRARLDVHEGGRRQRAQAARLSQRAALQQPDQQRLSRRLRDFRARHAVLGDDRDPVVRRLFPLAAIHQHQHHRLCRDRSAALEPRHRAHRRRPAIVALDRRRRRRAGGRDHAAAAA